MPTNQPSIIIGDLNSYSNNWDYNETSGGSRKFWWGGFEAQNLKNSDVFTKIESDFSAEIGNSNVFFAQIQVVSKKKKKNGLHQN